MHPIRYLNYATQLILGLIMSLTVFADPPDMPEGRLDHRDDYRMDSISGGAFRNYISSHISEDDLWARSMRTFGSFHNHMHEMMSHMAEYAVELRGDRGHVPEFTHRISGGQWAAYRKSLEAAGDDSDWYELVRITEIMHDRVHHAMARSLIRDRDARGRDADLSEYLRGDPMDHGEGIPAEDARRLNHVTLDEFREWAWQYDVEPRLLHESVQSMIVFAHMLDDLLTQWLTYGETLETAACRPAPGLSDRRGEAWAEYVAQIDACEHAEWREFVLVAGLMRDRIHHMMYKMKHYRN
ncbi:MAG: hypothetical protein JJU05_14585 [Verrucomicrobia bacterium]|nr:hypothetical protein [Verrucomicrobiota bacterium]MCH8528315.1 hypothetical protein [Kiritimatiellia bacterium]